MAPRLLAPALALGTGCVLCGRSCRGWDVPVPRAERDAIVRRLRAAGLATPAGAGFEPDGDDFRLRKRDGRCGFLGEDERCFLHASLGADGKPRVCQAFPWMCVSTPGVEYWTVSLACTDTLRRLDQALEERQLEARPQQVAISSDFSDLERPWVSTRERAPWRRWRDVRAGVLAALRGEERLRDGLRRARSSFGARRPRLQHGRGFLRDALLMRAGGPGLAQADSALCGSLAGRVGELGELTPAEEQRLRAWAWLRLFISDAAVEHGWGSALGLVALYLGLARVFALEQGWPEALFSVEKWFVHAPLARDWLQGLESWAPAALLG